MISIPSDQELQTLRSFHEPLSLTLYAPFIEPNGPDNPLRIEVKNLLRTAEAELRAAGASDHHIKATLRPIARHMELSEVWPTRHEALVFFSHPHLFRYFHVPDAGEQSAVTIGSSFDMTALESALEASEPYFVLMLGHKDVRLYEGDRYQLRALHPAGFPRDMAETLGIDEYPESRQTHSIASPARGKGSEAFHEQYGTRDVDKTLLKEFFRRIDTYLRPYLHKHPYPLILAGVDYVVSTYRSVNTYPRVAADIIAGNQADISLDEIRERAATVIDRGVGRM